MKSNCKILILFIGISLILFSSCNTVKYVADNEYLLKENTVKVNDKKTKKGSVTDYIVQRPNKTMFAIPVGLHFYNLGNKSFLNSYEVWKDSFPGKSRKLEAVLSEKQSRVYRETRSNFNSFFFKKGEAPVILDSTKTRITSERLKEDFIQQGYFRAKVDYNQTLNDNKRATVDYTINTDSIFKVDSITTVINSPILDSIFELHIDETLIKPEIDFNLNTFELEADRITKLYRNSGIYHFSRNSIGFRGDSTSNNYKSDILMTIQNRLIDKNDSLTIEPYYIQKVSKVNVYTDYSFKQKDKIYENRGVYEGYQYFTHGTFNYNQKFFSKFIFVEPNSTYSDIDTDLTRRNLRRLKNFRLINIKYNEIDSTNLEANIYLTPFKKYSFKASTEVTHSNIKQFGVSGKASILTRNIFKDASILQFSIQGAFFNSSDAADNNNAFFNAWEFGGDISLEVPRIMFPISTEKLISKKMLPQTKFTIGTSFQKNIGLDKQKFTGIISYDWAAHKTFSHRLEVFNAQYIKNLNVDAYFDIYQSEYNDLVDVSESIGNVPSEFYDSNGNLIPLPYMEYVLNPTNGFETTNPGEYNETKNIAKQYEIITENVIVPMITYEIIYNTRDGFKDPSYSFFRARLSSAGGLTNLMLKEPEDGLKKEILGIPVAQYIKLDLEYKKFWGNTLDRVLAFRAFLGIAVPYGNSDEIPFSRSYFIGGANDLRAWKVYELGPGATKTGLEYNVGSLKILTSLEYRFKIIDKFKGALFIDAGNIWDITNSDLIEPDGKFTSFSSLGNIAVGSGVGIRYDFSFLVIRLDAGFKTYEPYQPNGEKWFANYNFGNAVYNIGINYPF